MRKTALRFRFIDTWRIGETESWLTDMSARGLHLRSFFGVFASFSRGEAESYRYRVDITGGRSGYPEHRKALLRDQGWEYVCGQWDTDLYRRVESAETAELYADLAEMLVPLKKVYRRNLIANGILIPVAIVLLWLLLFHSPFHDSTPVLLLVSPAGGMFIAYTLMLFAGILSSCRSLAAHRSLLRTLREDKAIDHNADWRGYHRRGRLAHIILQCFLYLSLGVAVFSMLSSKPENLSMVNDYPMIVRLASIEENPALVRRVGYIRGGVDTGNCVTHYPSLWAKTVYTVTETGEIMREETPEAEIGAADGGRIETPGDAADRDTSVIFLSYEIYHLRFSFMADRLITDLLARSERIPPLRGQVVELPGRGVFDKLYRKTIPDGEDGLYSYLYRHMVFAKKGNYVAYIAYSGNRDIENVLRALTDVFDTF